VAAAAADDDGVTKDFGELRVERRVAERKKLPGETVAEMAFRAVMV
jgi:hypothetical protein